MLSSRKAVKIINNNIVSTAKRIRTRQAAIARPRKTTTAAFGADVSSINVRHRSNIGSGGAYGLNDAIYDTYLEGIIGAASDQTLHAMYKDIYYFDTVAGSAVDLMTSLPFSDFNLIGADESKMDEFYSVIERLRIKDLLGEISIDYLVSGAFVGTLIYREQDNMFTDIMPHDMANCKIQMTPLYGIDPLIKVSSSKTTQNFIRSADPYFARIKERLTPALMDALSSGEVSLEPVATMFIPRKSFTNSIGTSAFLRIVPVYLLEKLLYKGTITEASRRQRSILHIQMGSEVWEPTEQELSNIIDLFQQTDLDPIGSTIATRNDVQTNELRQGGDFWKYTDVVDITTQIKLRALGISESFLSGEGTIATMEMAMSVFIEQLRAFRETVVRKTLYRKLFPLIAITNGLYIDEKEQKKTTSNPYNEQNYDKYKVISKKGPSVDQIQEEMGDISRLIIPRVEFHKNLRPEADRDYMDILTTLSDQGVPIGIKAWAAAGGINLDSLEQDLLENKKIQELIDKHKPKDGDDGDGGGLFASAKEDKGEPTLREVVGGTQRQNILSRDFGGDSEVVGRTKTGKRKYIQNQRKAIDNENTLIANALNRLGDEEYFEEVGKRVRLNPRSMIGKTE